MSFSLKVRTELDIYWLIMKYIQSIDVKCLNLQSQIPEFTRKVKDETLIRSLFSSFKHQIKGHPKKEYLRCKLIRFHKRANRKIKHGKKMYNNVHTMSERANFNWNKLSEVYHQYASVLDNVSLTYFEPKKFKPKARPTCLANRSFNTEFCVKYFTSQETRESFFYFVEYMFSDLDPEILSKTFGFKCCSGAEHQLECAYKWLLLKRYSNYFLVEDLKLEAWFPKESGVLPPLEHFVN